MRRSTTAAIAALAGAATFAAASPASGATTVRAGTGDTPDLAVDAADTAYVAFKEEDAVVLCVLPRRARACAPRTEIAFPGEQLGIGEPRVLLGGAPGAVGVAITRGLENSDSPTYLATSLDGGRSFGPATQILASASRDAGLLPDGRVALLGILDLRAAVVRADGADGAAEYTALDDTIGQFGGLAVSGEDVVVAGSNNTETRGFRLPGGANAADPAAWQPVATLPGEDSPQVAGGPAGPLLLARADAKGLGARRLEGTAWGRRVRISRGAIFDEWGIGQGPDGSAGAAYTQDGVFYAASGDGGVRWSRPVRIAREEGVGNRVAVAQGTGGRATVLVGTSSARAPVMVTRVTRRDVPARTLAVGDALVQARTVCAGRAVRVDVRASRAGQPIRVGSVLRRATFRVRAARVLTRRRFAVRVRPRGRRARVRVTLVPRAASAGRPAVTLPARRCG